MTQREAERAKLFHFNSWELEINLIWNLNRASKLFDLPSSSQSKFILVYYIKARTIASNSKVN